MEQFFNLLNADLFQLNHKGVNFLTLALATSLFCFGFWASTHARRILHHMIHSRLAVPQSTAYTASTLIFYILVVLTLMVTLSTVGFDLQNIAIVAGALSVGIGLGLQSSANNFISGLLLLFDRALRVGDYIELNNNLCGHIKQIRMQSTIITTNDNIEIIVPNSMFTSGQIINWTLTDEIKRMHIPFSVDDSSDIDRLYDVMLELADTLPHVALNNKERKPQLWFMKIADSAFEFELILWVERFATVNPLEAHSLFLREIHRTLQQHEFKFSYPQHDIHIRSTPPLQVEPPLNNHE